MPVIRTSTTEGAAKGIVTVRAPHELDDQEVVWLQDALVDQVGFIRRRNGIPASGTSERINVVTDASNARYPQGIASCFRPDGAARFAVLYFDDGGPVGLWGAVYDNQASFIGRQLLVPYPVNTVGAVKGEMHVFTSQLPDGGVYITVAGTSSAGMSQNDLTYSSVWYGGGGSTQMYGTTISTLTINRGDTLATMASGDVSKLTPGSIIGVNTGNNTGVGIVRKIESATTVSLMAPYVGANLAAVANGTMSATMQPLIFRAQGLVSAVVGGSVTGYGTKFKTMMDNPTSIAYTGVIISQQDGQPIATFTTGATTTDTVLGATVTVIRNASLEPYRLLLTNIGAVPSYYPAPNSYGSIKALADYGILTFNYKGYTFWMNKANYLGAYAANSGKRDTPLSQRVWISGPSGPYDFDHDPAAGAWFDVASDIDGDADIMCGGATPNAAIICKRKSTFVVTGDDPDSFRLTKLLNEGALQGSKVLAYQNGVIWFGPTGIWYFDGNNEPINMVEDSIRPTYKRWAASLRFENFGVDSNATDHYAAFFRAFIYNDHLFLCMGGIGGSVPEVLSGNTVTATQNTATLVMYLPNKACSFWTNFRFIDFLPPEFNANKVGYVLLEQSASAVWTLVSLDAIMLANYPDTIPAGLQNDNFKIRGCCYAAGTTPSFLVETKRYSLEDPLNRKVWKGLAVEVCVTDNNTHTSRLKVAYKKGLNMNTAGSVLATWFNDSGNNLIFTAQRIKARERNQYLGFEIYEDQSNKPTFVMLGAWQMMYKPGRPGAI